MASPKGRQQARHLIAVVQELPKLALPVLLYIARNGSANKYDLVQAGFSRRKASDAIGSLIARGFLGDVAAGGGFTVTARGMMYLVENGHTI